MGGLGFNKDHKWDDAINKHDRMKKFAQNIGKMNSQNMHLRKSPLAKEKSKRDIAMEFAKKIKKPKLKPSPERFAIEFEETRERNKLWERDQNDKQLRFEEEKIKLLFQL
jgi:hypothetical protein